MFGLETIAPRFLVPSKRIKVLYDPSEFYSYLCSQISAAKTRVFLASLYLGKSEQELINVIDDALRKNDKLHVYVLIDGLRGTREAPQTCSASLLAPLAAQYPTRVQLSMYRTPRLGWLTSKVLPKRIIEGVGLQHMKLYGFDDEIVLSGANLSQDYFTNRQDRYISIRDKAVTNWFFKVQSAVSDLSYALHAANNDQKFTLTPPSRRQQYNGRERLAKLLRPNSTKTEIEADEVTEVFPVGQFTPVRLGNEHAAMEKIVSLAQSPEYNWMLTAGYFNVEAELGEGLAHASGGEIITAAPEANGFYKSNGISGRIPHFYSLLTKKFLDMVPNTNTIAVREWRRGVVNTPGGWSYHAKGIWLWATGSDANAAARQAPFLTYIGSSNFTRRSYRHDMECGAVLVSREAQAARPRTHDDVMRADHEQAASPSTGTTNPESTRTGTARAAAPLSAQLARETRNLLSHCGPPLAPASFAPKATIKDRILLLLFGDRL